MGRPRKTRPADVPVAEGASLDDALGGGEDYELLATLPEDAVDAARAELRESFGVSLTEIGGIIEEGLVAVGDDLRERALEPRGWDHFGR